MDITHSYIVPLESSSALELSTTLHADRKAIVQRRAVGEYKKMILVVMIQNNLVYAHTTRLNK